MTTAAGVWISIHPDLTEFAEELRAQLEQVDEETRGEVAITARLDADEAKAEFVRAAQLDLTAADKTELARQSPHA